MEAVVPAFILVLLAQFGDRSAWLVAALADRYDRPLTVAFAAWFGHLLGNAIAGVGAHLIAPALNGDAKQLLLALALWFAAAGALWRHKAPDFLTGWKLGSVVTSSLGVFILSLGDTSQFFTFALGVQGASPLFAFGGAAAAILIVTLAAALAGEKAWRALPIGAFRIGFGVLCLAAGAIVGAGALRLI